MMRKFQLTLLLVFLAATTIFAQRGHGQQRMLADLDLSTEQQARIEAIHKDTRSQLEALKEGNTDKAATRESAKALREKSKAATMAVLTPAQRTELEAKVNARKEAMKKVDKKAMSAELKAYRTEKMDPVMQAARGQFDQYLAAEDRTEIERLRAVFAAKPGKKGRGGEGRAKKGAKQDGKADKGAHREAAAQWRTDHADDIASLDALTEKYKVELERVDKLLAPQQKTWSQDMSAIKAKYLPEGAGRDEKGKAGKDKAGKGKGKQRADGGDRKGKGGNRKAAAFLLLKG